MYLFNPTTKSEPTKPHGFEYFVRYIVPVLGLVALIIAQLQRQEALGWMLLAVVVISVLAAFLPQVMAWIKKSRQTRKDEKIVRQQLPVLKGFVERFGQFVTWGQPPSVDAAIGNAFGQSTDTLRKFHIPSVNLFWGLWKDFEERATKQEPSVANFEATISELATQIATYNNFAMRAVFEQFPQELRAELDDKAKSELNACREHFNSFLRDYETFMRGLGDDFRQRHRLVYSLPRVKPL